MEYGVKKFAVGTHLTLYGDVKELGFGEANPPATAPDQFFPYVSLDNGNGVVPEFLILSQK